MPDEKLLAYVRAEVAKGLGREEISRVLIASGWSMQDVQTALIALEVPLQGSGATGIGETTEVPSIVSVAPTTPASPTVPVVVTPRVNTDSPSVTTKQISTHSLGIPIVLVTVVVLLILGGGAWYFISHEAPSFLGDSLLLTETDDWDITEPEVPLKEYRSEMLGIGFSVPERVQVQEESLGKYGTLEFFIGKKDNDASRLLNRTDFALLYVNRPHESWDEATLGKQTLANGVVETELKIRDSIVGGAPAKVYVSRTRSEKYNTDVEKNEAILFTHDGNRYTLGITGTNRLTDEDRELYKYILGTFYFFTPEKDVDAHATPEDVEASVAVDAVVRQELMSAAVFGEFYYDAHGNSYGNTTGDCDAPGSMFSDPKVSEHIKVLRDAGVTDIACYASGKDYAIGARRPPAIKESAYWCFESTGERCGTATQVQGTTCGECVDACNAEPEPIMC